MTARIYITLDETMFDVGFDCCGNSQKCQYAMCEEMPPVHYDDKCGFKKEGTCRCAEARIAAMNSVRRRLATLIKSTSEELYNE